MKKISVNCFPEPPPLPFSCLLVHSKWGKKDLILYICSFSALLHFPNSKIFSNTIFFKLSMTVLYFPYLIFGLALLLVLLERLLTRSRILKTWNIFFLSDKVSFRFFWTGQRIEKFYQLLVKDAIKVWVLFFCKWAKTYFWLLTRTTSPGTLFTVGKAGWLVNR